MNNISMTPVGYNTNVKRQNVAFKGQIGDNYVQKLEQGDRVEIESVMKDVKGTLGFKTDKVQDVLEAFINNIKGLNAKIRSQVAEISYLKGQNNEKQERLQQVENRYATLNESTRATIENLNKQLREKDKEVAEAKAFAEKYNLFANVKSIDEIDIVMPEEAIETAKAMTKNEKAARKSMEEYLFTGKGLDEALKQIERNNILYKARKDKITDIPSIKKELDFHTNQGYETGSYISDLIVNSLYGSPKGELLISPKIADTVFKNAMALLKPHFGTGVNISERQLQENFQAITEFHSKLARGKTIVLERIKNIELKNIVINELDGFADKTCIELEYPDGRKDRRNFFEVSNVR